MCTLPIRARSGWADGPVRLRSLDRAARAGIARTFQTAKLFGDMSVLEVREWMRLGESGFREWLYEPDLYADDRPTR